MLFRSSFTATIYTASFRGKFRGLRYVAGAFLTALVRLFDRFLMVGDPPDSEESVSSTPNRVLLKVDIVMWVVGCGVRSSYLLATPPCQVVSSKTSQRSKDAEVKPLAIISRR